MKTKDPECERPSDPESPGILGHKLLEAAFDSSTIGSALIEVDPDGTEHVLRVNKALCEITGYPESALVGDGEMIYALTQSSRSAESIRPTGVEPSKVEFEHTLERPKGPPVWLLVTLSPLDTPLKGKKFHRLVQAQDISDRRDYEARLQFLAEHDPLTGLANLKRFYSVVDDGLAFRRRYGGEAALISFDLDRFSLVNDAAGHAAGDETLQEFARFLTGMVRETDTVARLGGDEFAVFLPGVDGKDAKGLAEEILAEMRSNPIEIHPEGIGSVALSTSAGVTEVGGRDELEARDFLVEADTALYAAKRAGRNCVVDFRPGKDLRRTDTDRLTWAERTRRALKDGNFFLEAQPVLNLGSGEVVAYEALLRMNDPDEGVVYPPTFLYTAERFGLSAEIDDWVVGTVIGQLAETPNQASRVSLNLSAASLDISSDLPERIPVMLEVAGVDPGRLELEVTEGACVIDIERTRTFVRRMRKAGVRVTLDDFGGGYGSFHYLRHLHMDVLKLDGELIRSLTSSSEDRIVVEAVCDLAHGLGMDVVAKFVSDEKTAGVCQRLGVDEIEGAAAGPTLSLEEALRPS